MAKILDIGCGFQKRPGAVGIDLLSNSAADVFYNLNIFPWPFPNNEFDIIYATHVLEHLDDIIKTMEEIYRIAKPKARIVIEVPHFASRNMFTDPTHKHFFGARSFNYFIPGTPEASLGYSSAKFINQYLFLGCHRNQIKPNWHSPLDALLLTIINRLPGWYERYAVFLYPVQNIYTELFVNKERVKNS